MTRIVHSKVTDVTSQSTVNSAKKAEVVLEDGRTGEGYHVKQFIGQADDSVALSRAIKDANSKEIPKK